MNPRSGLDRSGPDASGGNGSETPDPTEKSRVRELEAVREVAHAFLTAATPHEVYRLALARVTPLVGADFSSVFLRDPADPELLRLACAHNWPQSAALYLGQLRVRVGRGPTGRAVAERRSMEVPDIFGDPEVREWREPARELGFASMISLPLHVRGGVVGALSFYFAEPRRFRPAERELLAVIAEQLSATAEKAQLIDDLRAANEGLRSKNDELVAQVHEAETARQLKNEFLANVSHELRTPLTSILGYSYLLKDGLTGELSGRQREAVERIDGAAAVLLRLIGDLIDLSQVKLRRVPVELADEDARELVRRAVAEVGPVPQAVSLSLGLPDQRIGVRTDGAKVVRILGNLVSNAFKFTPAGTVHVGVRRVDPRLEALEGTIRSGADLAGLRGDAEAAPPTGWVEWTVRDTGIGIPPDKLAGIFDEFRQVDGSSTRIYGGTGLGLALSLRLARLLGGDIGVESDPGAGSAFVLRIPALPDRAAHDEVRAVPAFASAPS